MDISRKILIKELMRETEQYLIGKGCCKSTLGVYKATSNRFVAFSDSEYYDLPCDSAQSECGCFLTTYDYAQTKSHVEKQLAYAGKTTPLFTDEALRCIYDYSSGLPRLINRACTQALGFAFQNGNSIVDDHIVKIVLTTELNTVA